MAAPKTYNPKKVTVIYGGYILTGLSSDGITITPNSDRATLTMGMNGNATRSMTSDYSAKIKISLLASSDDNDVMSGFENVDRLTGLGALPLLVLDNNGTSKYSCKAWIVSSPEVQFGQELGTREWTLETDFLAGFTGGAEDL